ncbi:hypothetical protein F2Q70_00024928 [Brassica cretica]|uniref:Uncharacterized protein n=1 Tax=Brassica cretica TaxID=69181 RepID=A0A8S9L1K2_BRACR|nr:hypothetical protein F2Q70_00024928 [Brassica cretica]
MNRTRKLVASISTLSTRRTFYPSSTFQCDPIQTISINSQTRFIEEKKYELDAGSLDGKYRDYAADQSAKVTEEYRTLTKRLSRAMYIMLWSFVNSLEYAALGTDLTNVVLLFFLKVQEKLKQWSDSFVEAFESHSFDEAV